MDPRQANAPHDSAALSGTSDPATEHGAGSLVLHEEVARASTERVATERVVLRKRIITEEQTITVQVRREVAELVRVPLDGRPVHEEDAVDRLESDTLVLHEERPVVTMEVVPLERLRLVKRGTTHEVPVPVTLGHEVAEVEGLGGDAAPGLSDRG